MQCHGLIRSLATPKPLAMVLASGMHTFSDEATVTVRFVITALFEFTRANARGASKGVTASTDAHAVLLNWSMAPDRSFHPVLDLPDLLVASLTWDERNDATSRNDLDSWCHRLGISVSSALRMSLNAQQDDVDLLSPN